MSDEPKSDDASEGSVATPSDGVRIIGAVEASVAATGQVPVVRPGSPPREGDDTADHPDTADGSAGGDDAAADDAPAPDDRPTVKLGNPLDRAPARFGAVPVVSAHMDPPTGAVPEVVPPEPAAGPAEPADSGSGDPAGEGPTQESFELPHYSEPATGQVPQVVIDSADDSSTWSTLSAQPRWRDTEHQFEEQPDFTDLIDASGPKLGALAERDESDAFFDADVDMASPSSGFAGDADAATVQQPARRPPRARRPASGAGGRGGQARQQPSAGRNLPVAIAVGVGLAAIGLICFKLGAVATTALVSAVLLVAGVEYFTTALRSGYQPATLLGMVAIAGLAWSPLYRVYEAYPIVLGLTMLAGLMWFLFVTPGEGALMNLGVTLVGVLWIGGLGSFATLLLGLGRIAPAKDGTNPGIGIILAAVLVSVSYDVGAFFVGRFLGRTPLSKASPNKTQEGLIGGFLAGWLLPFGFLLASSLHPIGDSAGRAAAFTLLCALVAPIGDLCESAIKRDLGVKDMGTLLPGHGGVFDRFDALVFVLPMAWFMAHLLAVPGF